MGEIRNPKLEIPKQSENIEEAMFKTGWAATNGVVKIRSPKLEMLNKFECQVRRVKRAYKTCGCGREIGRTRPFEGGDGEVAGLFIGGGEAAPVDFGVEDGEAEAEGFGLGFAAALVVEGAEGGELLDF